MNHAETFTSTFFSCPFKPPETKQYNKNLEEHLLLVSATRLRQELSLFQYLRQLSRVMAADINHSQQKPYKYMPGISVHAFTNVTSVNIGNFIQQDRKNNKRVFQKVYKCHIGKQCVLLPYEGNYFVLKVFQYVNKCHLSKLYIF